MLIIVNRQKAVDTSLLNSFGNLNFCAIKFDVLNTEHMRQTSL